MQTWFSCFFSIDLCACSILHGQFSFSKTSGPTTKATGSEVLLQVVYYVVRSRYINHANQVDHEKGGGNINYTVQLKLYDFDQIIFNCNVALTKYLKLHWEMQFQQPGNLQHIACKISTFSVPQAQPWCTFRQN